MKTMAFASRTAKEIVRDPLSVGFGLGFPIVLLLLMSAIQANIPVELFVPEMLTPGVAVFGMAFLTLFSATLLAKDRSSALLRRLYTTPLTGADCIFGYTLPLLVIAVIQDMICYGVGGLLGLPLTGNVFAAMLLNLPAEVFFIALGLLCGSVLNEKQVGGLCGALLTNLTGWLSGTWFDLLLLGSTVNKIAGLLPFVHAVELQRGILDGQLRMDDLLWVAAYAAVTLGCAIPLFLRAERN